MNHSQNSKPEFHLLQGAATILELVPSSRLSLQRTNRKAKTDLEKLCEDGRKVGQDMWVVAKKLQEEKLTLRS